MIKTYKEYEELRDEVGTRDYRVTRDLKLNVSYFYNWRIGKTKYPRIETLEKITDYLNSLRG